MESENPEGRSALNCPVTRQLEEMTDAEARQISVFEIVTRNKNRLQYTLQ